MIRLLKVVLTLFAALFCLMYAFQNLVNLQAAYGFVALMTGMTDHAAYPNHFGPAVTSPFLNWVMLWIIIVLEIAAGLLAAKGAFDLWRARNSTADEFESAKTFAVLGTGLAVVVWFGIFSAVGGAYFQMWQTEAGYNALENAFWFSAQHGLVLLIVNQPDR